MNTTFPAIPVNLAARMRDLSNDSLREAIADGEAARTRRDLDKSSKDLRATFALAARVELIRRDKAQSFQQNVCRICTKSFTQPAEEIPLVYCEPCFEKAICATIQVSADGARLAA